MRQCLSWHRESCPDSLLMYFLEVRHFYLLILFGLSLGSTSGSRLVGSSCGRTKKRYM